VLYLRIAVTTYRQVNVMYSKFTKHVALYKYAMLVKKTNRNKAFQINFELETGI